MKISLFYIYAICFLSFFFLKGSISTAQSVYVARGYMDKKSYNPGELSKVYINATGTYSHATLRLYDMNMNLVDSVIADVYPQQMSSNQPWANGFGYQVSFNYTIPELKSGMYLWEKSLAFAFIVKSKNKNVDITVVYASNTENAYNDAGGKSLYSSSVDNSPAPATAVSFQRPVLQGTVFYQSQAFFKWIAGDTAFANYNFNYIADMDLEDYSEIQNSKTVIITGHSEYWTRKARMNIDSFVNVGKTALMLSGNTIWWQVRYSPDKTQMICYKSATDPISNSLLKTILWCDTSLHYSVVSSTGGGNRFGGYGDVHNQPWYGFKITYPQSPLLAGTNLQKGDIISVPTNEFDGTSYSGLDNDNYPIVNFRTLNFYRMEHIGFGFGCTSRDTTTRCTQAYGTFMVFQKTPSSGVIIHVGSTNWCCDNSINGASGTIVKAITKNMIHLAVNKEKNLFYGPKANIVNLKNSHNGLPDGYVHLAVEGGVPPYSFQCSDGIFSTDCIEHLPPGDYTIVVKDYSGNAASVITTSVLDSISVITNQNVVIFPNPFNKTATLYINSAQLNINYSSQSNQTKILFLLYDLLGQEIINTIADVPANVTNSPLTITTEKLSQAIYFYKVFLLSSSGEQTLNATGKLIVTQ